MTDVLFPHLRSMTGQGRSEVSGEAGKLVVELRSVNNRGLKIILRTNEALAAYEGDIHAALSGEIERGTVTVQATLKPPAGQDLPQINREVVAAYVSQLVSATEHLASVARIDLSGLLSLPGVLAADASVESNDSDAESQTVNRLHAEARKQLIADGVAAAVQRFNEMRHQEAVSMAKVLSAELETIRQRAAAIESLAPEVIQRYQSRLLEKIQAMLAEHHLPKDPVDIIREVQLFADRSDISEEITRLDSHLELFRGVLEGNRRTDTTPSGPNEAVGRKLDFIIQEMFRETNTIGSKAGNATITEHVVEMKCAIERMRELIQNLE